MRLLPTAIGFLLLTSAAHAQRADLFVNQQPVSSSNPVPTSGGGSGGGGSVTQGTSPWVDNISQFGGVTVNLGQQARSASMPVVIASDQTAIPVTGSFFQSVQPVSQSGAPWSNNLTQVGGVSISLGQGAMAQSVPVVIASNQPALPVAGSVAVTNPGTPDVRATGQTINAATLNAAVTAVLNNGQGVVGFAVSGLTASAAILTAEGSNDGGTTWSSINTTAPGTGLLSTTVVADGQFRVNGAGHTNVRLRVSTAGTGTITVADSASSVAGLVALSAPVTGNVGGYTGTAQVSPAVSTTAYAAGQSVGGLLTLSGLVRAGQSGTLIQGVVLAFADTQTPSVDVVFFAGNPTASTIANGSAISIAGADVGKVRGVAHVSDCTSTGTTSVCQSQQQALSLVAATAGGPVYAALVARSAMTLGSTSDLTVTVTGPQD